MTTTSILGFTCSYHIEARTPRFQYIEREIGFGQQIVKERWHNGIESEFHVGTYQLLTETGIVLIVDEQKKKLVTFYVCDPQTLLHLYYNNPKKIPSYLKKKVSTQWHLYCQYKQQKYTTEGL